MNPPAVFAHFRETIRTLPRRRKVNVSEFGDGMAKRIIHLTQRSIPAMNMGDGDIAQMCRRRRRECLDAVSDHQHDIGLQPYKFSRQGRDRVAGRHGSAPRAPRNRGVNLHSINRPPMPRIKVHSGRYDLELQLRICPNRHQDRLHQSELGARARDKADAAAWRSGIFTRHPK
jgi:hypothetical protein